MGSDTGLAVCRPWSETLSGPLTSRAKKTKNPSTTIYPIFNDCADICDDPYWIDVLRQCSIGKLPKRFKYKDEMLYFRKNNKAYTVRVPENPDKALLTCIQFFRNYNGMASERDREYSRQQQLELQQRDQEVRWTVWTKVPQKIRAALMTNYLQDLTKFYGLNVKEENQLKDTVLLGTMFGYFHKGNIILEKERLTQIQGLNFDPIGRKFFIDPELKPKNVKSTSSRGGEIKTSIYPISHTTHIERKDQQITFGKEYVRLIENYRREKVQNAKACKGRYMTDQTDGTDEVDFSGSTSPRAPIITLKLISRPEISSLRTKT